MYNNSREAMSATLLFVDSYDFLLSHVNGNVHTAHRFANLLLDHRRRVAIRVQHQGIDGALAAPSAVGAVVGSVVTMSTSRVGESSWK